MKRVWFLVTLVVLLSLVLVACTGGATTTEQAPAPAPTEEEAAAPAEEEAAAPAEEEEAAAPAEEEATAPAEEEAAAPAEEAPASGLAAVCPNPVVIQTDWFPEAEHGALYQMVGDDYTVDTDRKVVRGSLIASGQDTGVDIEVRTGGPAIGFQQPIQQMYVETDILLGYVSTNEAVFGAEDTPTLSVVSPLEKNPQIIMWDPETYPDVETIADLGQTGATIQVFAGGTFIDVFVNEGIVSADQIDPSYDGSPARWVAANGAIAQQGFASAEPYVYENEIDEWGKPVAFQLIHDAGFEIYSQALAIRSGELEELRPCLEQLVPIVQQAVVDYVADPDRANAIIVDAVEKYKDFWVYSPGLAEFSVNAQLELGLVGNGPDGIVGNMEPARVQGVIDKMTAAGLDVPDGLQASDIITNEFIDETIGLPEMAPAEEEATAAEEAPAEAMMALGEVCPDPVVIQTDWFPEAEHGALYQMLGDDYSVDTDRKLVRGSLMASGQDTGIDIEVRTGGPAIGFQNPNTQMYVETDILLGYVSTDEAVLGAADTPTLAVVAPLEKNPQIIMWDPETYPDVETIADLKETGATINVFAGGTFIDVFVNEGVLSADQIDPSYDGSPARWVASNGAIAQQGFASAEPFVYLNEIEEWGKPVAFQLIHDAGLEIYSQALAIRAGELEQHRPCLEQLVPIIQQSVVDYVASPDRANAIIIDAVEQYQDFWVYTPELAEYSVNTQLELGLVGNGPDGIVGNMEPARVQGVIDKMVAAGMDIVDGLQASDISTNEFINESIGLP